MMLKWTLIILSFWSGMDADKARVERILDSLYESTGNYNFEKPAVKILDSERMVASYNGYDNAISVERKVLEICDRFGKDADAALAFLIAHELAHSFQMIAEEKGFVSDFLAFDKHEHSNKIIERNADLFGLFNCYLAGYQVDHILTDLLDAIYVDYNLKGKTLSSYPPLYERQKSSKQVREKMDTLVHLYEDAALLATSGFYEQSGINLEHILEFYQGREIYNNTGVNFILEALNMGVSNIDPFLYPVEIDLDSRLQKPLDGRGSKGLSPYDKIRRENLVNQGLRYFTESTKIDPSYLTGHVNTMVCYILLEEYQKVQDYYRVERLGSISRDQNNALALDRIRMCLAIAHAKTTLPEGIQKAERLLTKIIENGTSASEMAKYNLSVLKDEIDNPAPYSCDCGSLEVAKKNVNRTLKKDRAKPLKLKRSLHYAYSDKGQKYYSQYVSHDGAVSIQKIGIKGLELDCQLNTSSGVIKYCKSSDRLILSKDDELFLIEF